MKEDINELFQELGEDVIVKHGNNTYTIKVLIDDITSEITDSNTIKKSATIYIQSGIYIPAEYDTVDIYTIDGITINKLQGEILTYECKVSV